VTSGAPKNFPDSLGYLDAAAAGVRKMEGELTMIYLVSHINRMKKEDGRE